RGGGGFGEGGARREAGEADEGGAGDAGAGKVGGGGEPAGDVPRHLERLGELVTQEPEPRHLDGVAVRVGLDVEDLDVEQVARLGAVDVHRSGERVHPVQVRFGDDLQRRIPAELPVERVPGLD